jgi:hypothetical protein
LTIREINLSLSDLFLDQDILAAFGIRTGFSHHQISVMVDFYQTTSTYPDKDQKLMLAQALHLTEKQVGKWFKNRRDKDKANLEKTKKVT